MNNTKLKLRRVLAPFIAATRNKDYAWEGVISHLVKYGEERVPGYGNPYIPTETKQQILSVVLEWAEAPSSGAEADLKAFEMKSINQWYGPQGATPDKATVLEKIYAYYEHPEYEITYQVSDVVREIVFQQHEPAHLPGARKLYNMYKGDRKSNSGITGWGDRRDPLIRKRAIKDARLDPFTYDPIVVGTRNQRNKDRAIFMDSQANYYREKAGLYWLFDYFKERDEVAWRGDHYVELTVQNFLSSHSQVVFFEADYESMDTWIMESHYKWFLELCFQENLIDETLYDYAKKVGHGVFTAPLVHPAGVTAVPHALFSGIYPTNPFETPLNLVIQLEWVHSEVTKIVGTNLLHGVDYIIVIQGDDALIVFDGTLFPKDYEIEKLKASFAEFAEKHFHIRAKESKQRVSRTSGFFCKRQYKLGGYSRMVPQFKREIPQSIYPMILALMAIFEPEDGALATKANSLIKLFQVMDNARAHPCWRRILRLLWEKQPELHITISNQDVEKYNAEHNKNWRLILFGETFSIEKSPSAQLWWEWSYRKNS